MQACNAGLIVDLRLLDSPGNIQSILEVGSAFDPALEFESFCYVGAVRATPDELAKHEQSVIPAALQVEGLCQIETSDVC